MKISRTHIAAGFARHAALVAVTLGFSAAAAHALQTVPVPLAGKDFGHNNELHAESVKAVDAVPAGGAYFFRITGKVQGTEQMSQVVAPHTPIATLVKDVA